MELIGLSGTRNTRRAERFESPAEAIKWLRKRVACTAADSNGALNVWDDRDGNYRCEAFRHLVVGWSISLRVDSQTFTSYKAVREWVAKWLKEIE